MTSTITASQSRVPFRHNRLLQGCVMVFGAFWVWTFLGTSVPDVWVLENILVVLGLLFLGFSYRRYQFSDLSYVLIAVFLCVHVYGSMYSYAESPVGYWLQDAFGFNRNHYDRIVHFSFGFLLAYPLREMFLCWFKFPGWVAWVLPIQATLSVSGLYELVEWGVAVQILPSQGDAYLAIQGDIWDAQKDMFMALTGAMLATTVVSAVNKAVRIRSCV